MTDQQEKKPTAMSDSLFAKQMKILNLDDGNHHDLNVNDELERQKSLVLPPLSLPEKKLAVANKRIVWGGVIGFAAAAAVAVMILPSMPRDRDMVGEYSAKGGSRIQVYYRAGGVISELKAGETLKSGQDVRVSLAAGKDGKAYLAYVDSQQKLLGSFADLVRSGTVVKSGEKIQFPGSVRLTGANDGETAVVLLCDIDAVKSVENKPDVTTSDLAAALKSNHTQLAQSSCQIFSQKLR